jgi:hypothetical protein
LTRVLLPRLRWLILAWVVLPGDLRQNQWCAH